MDSDENSTGRTGPPLQGVLVKLIDWDEGNYKVTDNPPRGKFQSKSLKIPFCWSEISVNKDVQ